MSDNPNVAVHLRDDDIGTLARIGNELRQKCKSGGEDCEICAVQQAALKRAINALEAQASATGEVEGDPQSCREDDGCPTEGAVLRREWRAMKARIAELEQASAPGGEVTEALREYEKLRDHVGGCTDGCCLVKRPQGMHTNGGCRCSRDHIKAQRMMYAGQRLHAALAHQEPTR